jgi:hypothetical protein
MSLKLLSILGAVAAIAASAGAANADVLRYEGALRGTHEAPPNATTGQGQIVAAVDTDRGVLEYTVTYSGLTGAATAAGLHEAAANQPDPVLPARPPAGTRGQIHQIVKLTPAQIDALNAGHWFFDISTAANPSGEIRGALRRTSVF